MQNLVQMQNKHQLHKREKKEKKKSNKTKTKSEVQNCQLIFSHSQHNDWPLSVWTLHVNLKRSIYFYISTRTTSV